MHKFLSVFGFFGVFYSPVGMLSYISAIKVFSIRFSLFDLIFILYIVSFLILNLLVSDLGTTIISFRFYFGFILFYYIFKADVKFPLYGVFVSILILTPIEALLINTVIPAQIMPNFPDASMLSHFNPGGYQRPYSFGGNASVASTLLVVMYSLLPKTSNYIKISFLGCIFLFASGLGFISLILYVVIRYIKITSMIFLITTPIIILYHDLMIVLFDALGTRVDSTYILFLIEYKANQIATFFENFSSLDFIFGNMQALEDGYGGDFGWVYFVMGYGFSSFAVLVLYILSKATKHTIVPILICLISTLHYPVIFFFPGQVILGYLLAGRYRTKLA